MHITNESGANEAGAINRNIWTHNIKDRFNWTLQYKNNTHWKNHQIFLCFVGNTKVREQKSGDNMKEMIPHGHCNFISSHEISSEL